jgi:nucleolin
MSGLPYDSDEAAIRKFFDGCGDIISIRAPVFHDTGRLRGYAHVDFATAKGQAEALKRDGRYIKDRFINVEQAKAPSSSSSSSGAADGSSSSSSAAAATARPPGCTTVFVKGLPYEMDEAGVRADFSRFGSVLSVRLARWNHTQNTKGFGYVQFEHGFGAEAAMKAARSSAGGLRVGGRPVRLDWDAPGAGPRASFRAPDKRHFSKTEEGKQVRALAAKSGGAGKAGGPAKPFHNAGAGGGQAAAAAASSSSSSSSSSRRGNDDEDGSEDEAPRRSKGKGRKKAASSDDDDDNDGSEGDAPAARSSSGNPFKKMARRG